MAIFELFLSRTYRVLIDAKDKTNASMLSEFFIESSESKCKEKEYEICDRKCKIMDVELIENNAFDTHEATLDQ